MGFRVWSGARVRKGRFLAHAPSRLLGAGPEFRGSGCPTTPAASGLCLASAADVVKAERLAWLADQAGFEFWLDVLDSNLLSIGRAAAAGVVSPTTQAQLVACVIEMALLNSTHVLVAMTPNTSGSAWVPYELGRAKDAAVYATQASAWVSTTPPVPSLPEYLLLIPLNYSEPAVDAWLALEYQNWCGSPSLRAAGGWRGTVPPPL